LKVVLRLLVGLFAVFAALGVAQAQDTVCTSITQRDCAPLPRVMAKGNLRVEILTQKRELSFVPGPDDEPCHGGGKCVCGEVIEHLDFKGPVHAFREVNAAEMRAAAAAAKCSVENSTVTRSIEHYLVSPHFISIAAFELEYCHSCGGSCHGTTVLSTYDAANGRLLRVGEVVKPDQVEALRRFMADDFAAKNFGDEDRAGGRKKLLVEELARRPLKDAGIYVENGTVFVDLDSFAMGCAGGSFHPIAVPVVMLTPAIARLVADAPR
jgi:hypothetical protein